MLKIITTTITICSIKIVFLNICFILILALVAISRYDDEIFIVPEFRFVSNRTLLPLSFMLLVLTFNYINTVAFVNTTPKWY